MPTTNRCETSTYWQDNLLKDVWRNIIKWDVFRLQYGMKTIDDGWKHHMDCMTPALRKGMSIEDYLASIE